MVAVKTHSGLPKLDPHQISYFAIATSRSRNIIVDPKTLTIEGIIDWEHGGYWPAFFDSPFFRDPRAFGAVSESGRLDISVPLPRYQERLLFTREVAQP